MAVPKMSQLRPGVMVNVVLKAHQQSGKLTTGQISEILTRGDHPRGIKVRLSSGEIGRVQSLSLSSEHIATAQTPPYVQTSFPSEYENAPNHSGGRRRGRSPSQGDYRQDPTPLESRSLADQIKTSPSSRATHPSSSTAVKDTTQAAMEKEFPKLDTALIAAILADHEDINNARGILGSLS
ncbi:hypothetical protein JMJ35_005947 [Cladonia borealis]|uniref:Uncharacterized protein n=1 Tax=Cladonia borealis TaxID=184061 RepID=A0AA39R014_9LECA|nr:hypothetical protein JMJ35_005947 [Cladonia borealis]